MASLYLILKVPYCMKWEERLRVCPLLIGTLTCPLFVKLQRDTWQTRYEPTFIWSLFLNHPNILLQTKTSNETQDKCKMRDEWNEQSISHTVVLVWPLIYITVRQLRPSLGTEADSGGRRVWAKHGLGKNIHLGYYICISFSHCQWFTTNTQGPSI